MLSRSVRCIEINKESKVSFEKTVDRLPNSVESSISWHLADTSKVSNLLKVYDHIFLKLLPQSHVCRDPKFFLYLYYRVYKGIFTNFSVIPLGLRWNSGELTL